MNFLDQFIIPLKDLKEGISDFTFKINDTFFNFFEERDIKNTDIIVKFILTRVLSVIEIDIIINGEGTVMCDRCLDDLVFSFNRSYKLYLKTGEEDSKVDSDIIYITDFDQNLNIAQYIYEYIEFSLPLQKIHLDDEDGNSACNKQMLKKLSNINNKIEDIDPRWDGLKKIRGI